APEIERALQRDGALVGARMMTTNGCDLGVVADVYFDEETGAIEGYEVSGGVFGDASHGRTFVPAPEAPQVGREVVFVPPGVAESMEERPQAVSPEPGLAALAGATVEQTLGRRARDL